MSSSDRFMWPTAIGAVIVLVVLLASSQLLKKPKPDATGCDAKIAGKTVFVLDQSEEMSAQTSEEILARVRKFIAEKVADGELVSVFTVTELSKKNLVPVFSFCKPTREGSRLTSNTKLLERNYQEKFAKPLEKALKKTVESSKESPVAQAIVDVSLSEYLTGNDPLRLIVFSDLMEHTSKFSLYGCRSVQDAIQRFRESRGATIARPAFVNVEVEVNVVPRSNVPASVGKCRDTFWVWFFGDNTGARASFTPTYLPG